MPYTEVFVATPVFFVHNIGKLYIPVYHTYKNSYFDERLESCFSFGKYSDDPDFDVYELPGAENLEGINVCFQKDKWEKIVKEVIGRAINTGGLPEKVYPDDLHEKVRKALNGEYEPEIPDGGCPECGNASFFALQKCFLKVIVDSNNEFTDNVIDHKGFPVDIYEKKIPQGPYVCTLCCSKYLKLPNRRDKKE